MSSISLDSMPYGDNIYVIYYISGNHNAKVYNTGITLHDDGYYIPTFREIFTEIENKEKGTISHCMIIAESGLHGTIYRYNNYDDHKIYECGTTRGYS